MKNNFIRRFIWIVYCICADTRSFDHTDQTTAPHTRSISLAIYICLGSKLIQLIAQRIKRTQIIINYALTDLHTYVHTRIHIYISKCNLEALSTQINCGHTVAHTQSLLTSVVEVLLLLVSLWLLWILLLAAAHYDE